MLILLPTRRSVRALREAFLRAADGKPTLLPRMAPLGDLDESEWEVASGDGSALALPPAIEPAEREALLARAGRGLQGRRRPAHRPVGRAGPEARARARRACSTSSPSKACPFDRLEGLVEGNFASHWQRTLKFLAIVGEHWPKMLAERGQIDAIDRRTRAIRAQATRWRERPPATPVIAAGSTGSQPATRELLAVIAGLPQGAVVLPGLDREMDEESWTKLDPTHPQFGLRELLLALGLRAPRRRRLAGRRRAIGAPPADRRADAAGRDHRGMVSGPPPPSLEHVTRADCATPHQEALVDRAGAARGAGGRSARTAALVTPDRDLARRVAAELRRWNIDIDDFGRPAAWPTRRPPTLLRALVAAVDDGLRAGRPARPAEASAVHAGLATRRRCSMPRAGSTANACAG